MVSRVMANKMILPPPIGTIQYIYRDEQIIVVDKPANMLSVPGNTAEKQNCLIRFIQRDFPEARIVHRLDFSTSGIMVIAQDRQSHRELSRQFQDREAAKKYIANIYGCPDEDSGEINMPLRCDWDRRPRQIVDNHLGKPSRTFWTILKRNDICCRVSLTPVTGRSHQLRVHMQAIKHPILGDEFYAHETAFKMADRLELHAKELTITHPATNNRMTFRSKAPF